MAGTLRNLRATATAEVSNLEQGMKRAALATRQVGAAAEEASRRGSRAMDELGRRSSVSMGVLASGGRNAVTGLLMLGDVAGGTSSRVGGLLSTMVTGFAGGGAIGLGAASLRHVDDRSEDEQALVRLDRIESDIDGDLVTVLVDAVQLAAGAHRTHAGL